MLEFHHLLGQEPHAPALSTIGVGLEQDASVEQRSCVRPAAAHERLESSTLLIGEAHYILLVHGDHPRWLVANEGTRPLLTMQPNCGRGLVVLRLLAAFVLGCSRRLALSIR